ncbi:MAG: hypothetical protein O7H41_12220 [Planctomycetota bacterium]|nr:hypothetical protein [Planctomycetota bacterium]
MKQVTCLGSLLAVILGSVTGVRADEVKVKGLPKITISGEVDLRGVFRNDDLMDINAGILRVPSGSGASHSDFFADPDLLLNIDIENPGTPLWNARLAFKTPQYLMDDFGAQMREVHIKEGYIEVPQLIIEPVKLRFGIMDYKTDVRKNGQSFLFHPYESESAFFKRFGNSAGAGGPIVIPVGSNGNGTFASAGTSAAPGAFLEGVGPGSSTGEANTLETAGALLTYATGGISLEAFYFNLVELRDVGIGDEVAFGAVATYDLQERGRVQALYIGFEDDSSSHIHNIGVGASVLPIATDRFGSLEAYGEFVYQFGKLATNVPDLGGRDLRQDSFATYAGVRYVLPGSNLKPGFDFSYWYIKGDNTSNSNVNNDFVSYENIDDTMIVEENDYGLDIDTNYMAWKFRFMLGWDLNDTDEIEQDFELSVLYANFHLEQAERNQPEKIGDEIDVRLLWNYSTSLSFYAGAGWLWDARAINHGHKVTGTAGAPDGNDLAIFTFGTTLKF